MSELRTSVDRDELGSTTLRPEQVAHVLGVGLDSHGSALVVVGRDMDHAVALPQMPDNGAHLQRLLRDPKLAAPVREMNDDVIQDPPLARTDLGCGD